MRRRHTVCAVLGAAAAAAHATLASLARADDTSECIAASEAAQQLRDDHALLEARDKLIVCARPSCPAPIRRDCIDLGAQVDAAIPTIVLRARDSHGVDIVDVKLYCDGVLLATKLDGKAFRIDPGAHACRFEPPGQPATSRTIVLGEGEKNRLEVVELPAAEPAPRRATAIAIPSPPVGASSRSAKERVEPRLVASAGVPWAALLAAGAGIAALVPMGIFWASGTSDIRQMRSTCAPSAGGGGCPSTRVDSARTKLVVGDAFLAVGVAGIATGAVLYFLGRNHSPDEGPLRIDGKLLPGGAYVAAEGRF
jgi:hypothetical protein